MPSQTRRSFLSTAAALPVGSTVAAQVASGSEPDSPGDLKLAVATYSLRKFSRTAAIGIMKELGIRYANVKAFHMPYYLSNEELKQARAEFERAGIEIVAGGNISLKGDTEAELEPYFKYAVAAGMPVMVCAPKHSNLGVIERLAIKYDRKMAIHNHGPEDRFYPAPSDVIQHVKDMDPRMGLCIDVGHTVRTGADILEEIDAAWGRVHDFHVKDLLDFTRKDSQVAVGDGRMPVAAIFQKLKERGYTGVVGLEYEVFADHPQLGMAKSFSYMRGVLDGQAS